ncbi:MAG: polysaccharide biosynthesis tyrosine autokinase [Ruminococcaceae bacterium]|nr:polysaccharide biosynthesis tyrosine autokinase [Oscillospiraceae bacterium]
MDEKEVEKNGELTIDVQRILSALMNKIWVIGIVAVLCAALTLVGTIFLIEPKYQSSVMFYVNNNSLSLGDVSIGSITSADISASRGLVKSYIVILNTRETINDVIDYAGVKYSYGSVKGMISAAAVDSTEIFQVVVTHTDPAEAERIASAIAYILPKRIDSIINGSSAKIVDSAIVPSSPSSPNYTTNTLVGFLIGALAVCVIVILRELFDVVIRKEEDVLRTADGHPILATVPNMDKPARGGYYKYRRYGYGYRQPDSDDSAELVGPNISFAASEAYKLLRTKLQFSFTDSKQCHIIGVSSALAGEGKSLTAVNLAYSLSQLGKRVLLLDCDMRCPSVADKLDVHPAPGLSDFLSGQVTEENLIQYCNIKSDEHAFHVISSGSIPPNPMELLGSKKMERTLEKLRQNYDYLILDLPPVGEVGDALTTAKIADGMLLVVRQNYCNRIALRETLRQFAFVGARILGIVFNYASEEAAGYSYKYLHRYYKRYGYGYGYHGYYRSYRGYGRSYSQPPQQEKAEKSSKTE